MDKAVRSEIGYSCYEMYHLFYCSDLTIAYLSLLRKNIAQRTIAYVAENPTYLLEQAFSILQEKPSVPCELLLFSEFIIFLISERERGGWNFGCTELHRIGLLH